MTAPDRRPSSRWTPVALAALAFVAAGCRSAPVLPATGAEETPAAADGADDPSLPRDALLRVERLRVGGGPTNAYLLWGEGSSDALVVDPGADAPRILAALERRGLCCRAIVLTHGHADHAGAAAEVAAATGAPIGRHPLEGPLTGVPGPGRGVPPGAPVRDLAEGDAVRAGPLSFRVLHTPGHSPGGISLHGHGVLLPGDLLFRGSVGRTDLPGGSEADLRRSLRGRLAAVPDATRVLPGHGEETVLGFERRTNPWLR